VAASTFVDVLMRNDIRVVGSGAGVDDTGPRFDGINDFVGCRRPRHLVTAGRHSVIKDVNASWQTDAAELTSTESW